MLPRLELGNLSLIHFEKAPYPLEDSYIGIAQPKEHPDELLPSVKTLRNEIDEKSEVLFEKSIDSQIKLKKLIDKDKKIYNEADKKSLEYLIENSE